MKNPNKVRHFSDKYYPHADELVEYLNAYANKTELNVVYSTDILNVTR